MQNLVLQALREEDSGLQLQKISSFLDSDSETYLSLKTSWKECNKKYFIIKSILKAVSQILTAFEMLLMIK